MGKQKTVSQRKIADQLGISVSTVSRSLNNEPGIGDEVRTKVRETAVELGYPLDGGASAPARQSILTAIIPLSIMPTGASGFHQAILNAIEEEARGRKMPYEAFFLHDASRYLEEIAAITQDGAVRRLLLIGLDQAEVVGGLQKLGIPSLIVNGRDERMEIPGIAPANERGAALACQHLIDLGHRDIAICTSAYRSTLQARIRGYKEALERGGLKLAPQNFIEIDRVGWNDAHDAISHHLNEHGRTFTALLCGNDMVAIGAIKALKDHGLSVPENCSVVGFDGVSAGVPISPKLTTVKIDCAALGRMAVQRLAAMSANDLSYDLELACSFDLGQSSGAVPKTK